MFHVDRDGSETEATVSVQDMKEADTRTSGKEFNKADAKLLTEVE